MCEINVSYVRSNLIDNVIIVSFLWCLTFHLHKKMFTAQIAQKHLLFCGSFPI